MIKKNKNIIDKAIFYASDKHKGQLRRDTTEDYITHPLKVFQILAKITTDTDILVASLLHDTIEDTDATYIAIKRLFGARVSKLVLECTKPYTKLQSKEALMIKFADMLDNVNDSPLDGWILKKCDMIRGQV